MEAMFLPGQQDCIFQHDNTQSPAETKVFNLFSLKGKTAIVTGAASGIGLATVEALAEAGANVALWYNSNKEAAEKATKIAKAYGVICKAYKVDVTNEEAIETAVDLAVRELNGRLDIFVANAGIPWIDGCIIDSRTELFQNILNINLLSVYFAAKAAGRQFRRQKVEGTDSNGRKLQDFRQGSFIVTSSISGMRQLMPQAGTPYGVSKAALTHFVKCLAVEWVQFARVNAVSPAYIATEMLEAVPDSMRNPWRGKTPMG
ncbi:hypothetical protein ABW20_dc0108673 [Dactylellina cionopaga]|nr:hypothetical protein ABW20_dc0108673 [Dactylellina cionopaga]